MGWIERAGAAKDENRELGLGLGFCKGFVGGEMCQNAFCRVRKCAINAFISLRFFGPKNFSAFETILRFSAAFLAQIGFSAFLSAFDTWGHVSTCGIRPIFAPNDRSPRSAPDD